MADATNTLVMITRAGMGQAEEALGHKLIRTWLTLVKENRQFPGALCFYAHGVHLVAEGSPVLDLLHAFEAEGVHLIVCSTCLEFYGLREKVKVGVVGGMGDILAAQWKADKVITL